MSIEILAMLKPGTAKMDGSPYGGIAEITPQDVLAALGLARLSRRGESVKLSKASHAWGRFVVLQDETCGDELRSLMLQELLLWIIDRRCSVVEAITIKMITGLVRLGVHERLFVNQHKACHGDGCAACDGTGAKRLSLRDKAMISGISKTLYGQKSAAFEPLVEFVYSRLGSLEQELNTHLNRVLFGENMSGSDYLEKSSCIAGQN